MDKLKLNVSDFLKNYWQKKPLLIRQAYPAYQNPISPDELAGLACEREAEARLIIEKGGRNAWELRHGPFKAKEFAKLPESHWTLLVQATNHWVPELQALLDDYHFLPQWRIEDIMTSFAVKQGSVGAHIDNYDVFLLQAEGQREWQISNKPMLDDDFVPGLAVKILKQFRPAKTFILNPGDMLYLPPRFAHHGIALTDCITHSIGFRAPSHIEILDDYFTQQLSLMDHQVRYCDPDLKRPQHSGKIDNKALARIIQVIRSNAGTDQQIKRWFGQFITQNKYTADAELPGDNPINKAELKRRLKNGETLLKNPTSRFSYLTDAKQMYFYANGKEFLLKPELHFAAPLLCASFTQWQAELPTAINNNHFISLLLELMQLGHFAFAEGIQRNTP